MATTGNVKISELTKKTSVTGIEILPISFSSDSSGSNYVSQSITTSQICSYVSDNIPGGSVTSVTVKMNGSNKGTITTSGIIDLGTVVTDVSGKENSSNKTTSLSSSSTDTQYPSAKAVYNMVNGYATATTIASIPITSPVVKATISTSGLSFSLASTPAAGVVIDVIIYNSSSSDITITVPTGSPYVDLSDTSGTATVSATGYLEINCISDGTNIYLRTA